MADSKRTGVFYSKSGDDYAVLWQGREICRYQTMEAFIDAHKAGLDALEANQADLLEGYYRSMGIHTGKNPGRSGLP